jgi:hypothetical protein
MTRFLSTIVLALALVGCSDASDVTKADDVEKQLNATLKVGASINEVESTLGRLNIEHSFDKYASRYQGIIRNTGGPMDHAVVVYVYMDDNGKLTMVETHDSYTGP